jgi:hypothetical protein
MSERKFRRTMTKVIAGTLTTGVILTAGIAFAAWTAGGSGNGYAKAATVGALTTVDASASTTAQLYPGGTGDVKITVSNPNAFPVTVTGVSGSGTITSNAGATCTNATGVTFTDTTGLTDVAAASTTTTITLTNKASMSNSSNNACQGAIFTIPVTLTGTVG